MSAFLGGFRITAANWIAPQTLAVQFSSVYSDRFHQVYLGRTLAGVTGSTAARIVHAIGSPSQYPEELTLVAVTADDRLTDFGSNLPQRPYNRARLKFATSGWGAAGVESIEIVAGTSPGGAVDESNVLVRIPFDQDRTYEWITDPLPGSGTWNFGIAGRDNTQPRGNRGSELAAAASIVARPADVAMDSQGRRLTVSAALGNASVAFTYNW